MCRFVLAQELDQPLPQLRCVRGGGAEDLPIGDMKQLPVPGVIQRGRELFIGKIGQIRQTVGLQEGVIVAGGHAK